MKQLTIIKHVTDVQIISTRNLSLSQIVEITHFDDATEQPLKPIAFDMGNGNKAQPLYAITPSPTISYRYS